MFSIRIIIAVSSRWLWIICRFFTRLRCRLSSWFSCWLNCWFYSRLSSWLSSWFNRWYICRFDRWYYSRFSCRFSCRHCRRHCCWSYRRCRRRIRNASCASGIQIRIIFSIISTLTDTGIFTRIIVGVRRTILRCPFMRNNADRNFRHISVLIPARTL